MSDSFQIMWRFHHKAETGSTNLDARAGTHGDVFTADFQAAGRGRLDHKWLSPPGANLMMSVVLSVEGLAPDHVATLPLVAGLSVCRSVSRMVGRSAPDRRGAQGAARPAVGLKWPNDVLVGGKKIAGILCERHDDNVIVGIGVNVNQTEFPPEIADRATSVALVSFDRVSRLSSSVLAVRAAILRELDGLYSRWRSEGFAAVYPAIAAVDHLKGLKISVRQTDDDSAPLAGVSNGIMPDGTLDVGGERVYAGEAHVENL